MDEKQIAEIEHAYNIGDLFDKSFLVMLVPYIPALIAEVRRLRAVVAEYADRGNWVTMMPGGGNYVWYPSENGMDGYTRAENALKEGE